MQLKDIGMVLPISLLAFIIIGGIALAILFKKEKDR
jgi:hypothetical protein